MEEFESQTEHVEEHLHEHAHHAGEKWISGVALTAALLAALAATTALLAGHHVNEAMLERMKASDHWSYYQSKGIKAGNVENRIDVERQFAKLDRRLAALGGTAAGALPDTRPAAETGEKPEKAEKSEKLDEPAKAEGTAGKAEAHAGPGEGKGKGKKHETNEQKLARYAEEQQEIFDDAKKEEAESDEHFARHVTLARGVTLFQVAIAVAAISALTKRRAFWFVGIALGCAGVVFLVLGLLPVAGHGAAHPEGAKTETVGHA